MFCDCSSLTTLSGMDKWNTKKVTNMAYMFDGCSKLKTLLGISKWNTKNVTNMSCVFSEFLH